VGPDPPDRGGRRGGAGEDGAAGGRSRGGDRVELGAPATSFLTVARDDEQGVVDAEREPHPRDHVHDEDRKPELEREKLTVPAALGGELIVGERIGAQLGLREVRDADGWDQLQPKLLGRHPHAMTGDDPFEIVDHHRPDETEMR